MCASMAFELAVVLRMRLHSFSSILGNTVRRVNICTFTNSVLVTLGGISHSRGAVAVATNWRVPPVIVM